MSKHPGRRMLFSVYESPQLRGALGTVQNDRLPPTAQRAAAAGAPARHPWLVAVRMLGELP
jgi:hypothetical protein